MEDTLRSESRWSCILLHFKQVQIPVASFFHEIARRNILQNSARAETLHSFVISRKSRKSVSCSYVKSCCLYAFAP
jgi:hypothetical protein